MRDQLIRYVDLLFAGAPNACDIKQEILQNTLDRFDDLVAQGKTPEAAYSLAISGIGDINEILVGQPADTTPTQPKSAAQPVAEETPLWKKILRAVGICLYIICPIPLFVLGELNMGTLGLCGTLAIVGVATTLMIIAGGKADADSKKAEKAEQKDPPSELEKAIKSTITTIGLVTYFVVSFLTGAWAITWLIFPIMGAVEGLAKACLDLKEANKHAH